ncbi:polysaccharide biosynthesis protein [Anaerocolumna cellulosilytica]|uniref:Polysaccharide biosynthesis protein n=1 Tax=Anaerocolumna cellulosilytica TaxID=433286 RepID=A0A6S6R744_9FIRM|nr:polysaccharide biosynthesis protein [Anaerocolumna cellulosilytica]MBB5193955.1 stage V sporulation protein B [Anaerocolumna cellulosilytica]BCJ94831.1 polysaccharide biosynthesis protein [Anaerocolumna cellulosilytica]
MTKNKSNLIKGTLVLTLAGVITRLIGFFYRIFLSNSMGPEVLGIYQLVFPVYGICFTIFASGIQTAISTLVANELGQKHYVGISKVLKKGILMSVSTALVLSFLTYRYSDFLAISVLREANCVSSIKLLALAFPFCGITSCINGYYYGLKKAGVPAATQLLEQIVRVITVFFLAGYAGNGDIKVTSDLAVLGLVIGEFASQLYNIGSMYFNRTSKEINALAEASEKHNVQNTCEKESKSLTLQLFKISLPLTANRLLISILHSVEAILIPSMLKLYGLSSSEALSIYGVLTGMSVPFIMFPSAITNSLSVLLLPTISEAQSSKNTDMIKKTTSISIKYSLLIGIISSGLFISFGQELGNIVFHNKMAGSFLTTLAWLCPFLYITTTLSSIINGLGLAHLTFINSVVGLSVRILMILYFVPKQGITGYLTCLLVSQLVITCFDGLIVMKHIKPPFQASDFILKPSIIVAGCSYIMYRIYEYFRPQIQGLPALIGFCTLLCVLIVILLGITKAVSLKDFK